MKFRDQQTEYRLLVAMSFRSIISLDVLLKTVHLGDKISTSYLKLSPFLTSKNSPIQAR